MQTLFGKEPPWSYTAEAALLGAIILDPAQLDEVSRHVRRDSDFYSEPHAALYRAMVDLWDTSHALDLVLLDTKLRDQGILKLFPNGIEDVVKLAESVPAPAVAPHYAKIVADKSKLRRLVDACGRAVWDAYHAGEFGENAKSILDSAETAIFEVAQESVDSRSQSLAELLEAELARIEAADFDGAGYSGVATGYYDLDEMLRGFQPGEFIIVAARPSMGKTALALNLAEQIAVGGLNGGGQTQKRQPVGIFSLEMSKSAIVQRLLSARSGVSSQALRGGHRIPDKDLRDLMIAAEELKTAPVYVDDSPDLTVLNLRARARRMVQQYGVKCIMIDYLQLMSAPSAARESRQVEVSTISRGVKSLARELNIPVICLSQLNRGSENREGNRPRMSDLRESGSIEQDADVVILLHREEYYHVQDEDWKTENPDKIGVAELIIAKQRNGPTGIVKLFWDNKTTRFRNLEQGQQYQGGGYDIPPAKPVGTSRSGGGGAGGGSGGGGYASPSTAAADFGGVPWTQQGAGTGNFGGGFNEPKPNPPGGSSFANRPKTGPPEYHRDGGGSDQRPESPEPMPGEEPPFD
jgi:replicative DNA helicase